MLANSFQDESSLAVVEQERACEEEQLIRCGGGYYCCGCRTAHPASGRSSAVLVKAQALAGGALLTVLGFYWCIALVGESKDFEGDSGRLHAAMV